MANSALIQSRINKGLAKAARILGDQYAQYRPNVNSNPPIAQGNLLQYVKAAFANDKKLMFDAPALYHNADTWYGMVASMQGQDSGGGVQPGDYFVGPMGTIFVTDATSERFVALHCIWCNRTINVGRALDSLPAGGSTTYSGESILPADLTPIMTQWPCSFRIPGTSGRARDAKMKLPTDALELFYAVLLPPLPGSYPVEWNDIVTDDLGRTYVINGIEQSPQGTRLSVEQWPT